MNSIVATTGGQRSACAYPGCSRPPRSRAGSGGGKLPIYCDLRNDNTGNFAHTPVTARREEDRRSRKDGGNRGAGGGSSADVDGAGDDVGVGRLATAARERAGSLLEQFRAEIGQLSETIVMALDEFAAAADPDAVRAELNEAHRRVERIQFEAAEQVRDAHHERDQAMAAAAAATRADAIARRAADDAERLRIELADLRCEHKKELADLRTDNKAALTDQATQLRQLHEAEIMRLTSQIAAATGASGNHPALVVDTGTVHKA